jgi:two-component system response regulator YcbB
MRIYIIEDDISVISVLEDIIEQNELGTICGDNDGEAVEQHQVLALDPDLILIDLLMPGKDGIQIVRELREAGCHAKFIMLSQVSDKDMVAKAYTAGVEFFIQKPINLIEVCQVIRNVRTQLDNERALKAIQQVFAVRSAPASAQQRPAYDRQRRRMKAILSQLGMAGEKGAQDIIELCVLLLQEHTGVSQIGMSNLCARLNDSPRTTEQRARRALEKGLKHIASLGLEDYNNETFVRYSARLFPFQEVRSEMLFQQGKGDLRGKANLKTFLDGLMILAEEE